MRVDWEQSQRMMWVKKKAPQNTYFHLSLIIALSSEVWIKFNQGKENLRFSLCVTIFQLFERKITKNTKP